MEVASKIFIQDQTIRMGKNSPSFVLKAVFKDISSIENVIQDSKKLAECCDKINFDNDRQVTKLIEDTKVIVNSLKTKTTKLSDLFHDNYKSWKNGVNSDTGRPDSSIKAGTTIKEEAIRNKTANNNVEEKAPDTVQTELPKGAISFRKDVKSYKHPRRKSVDDKDGQPLPSQPENENVKDQNVLINSSIDDAEEILTENNSTTDSTDNKTFIKCVDIKKLMKPDVAPIIKPPLYIIDSDSDTKESNQKLVTNRSSKSTAKETTSNRTKTVGSRRKINKDANKTLSDITSTSESETSEKVQKTNHSNVENRKKSTKMSNKIENSIVDSNIDKKLYYKCHVPLPRIPSEQLKQHYLKQKEIGEVQRLTNLSNLKRKRANRTIEKKDNNSSSDSENLKSKLKRKKPDAKRSTSANSTSDEESIGRDLAATEPDLISSNANQESDGEIDEHVVKTILDGVKSDSNASDNKGEDDESNKKKKKGDNEKTTELEKKKLEKNNKDENPKKSTTTKTSNKENSKWRKEKLLTARITDSDSDSEDELIKFKKRGDVKQIARNRMCRKKAKNVIDSESNSENECKKSNSSDEYKPKAHSSSESESEKSETSKMEEQEEEDVQKKKRQRIKRISDSSSDDENKSTRKNIRRVIANESLTEATKRAEKDEKERKARIAERQKKYNKIFDSKELEDASVDKVVLDFNEETKEEILAVDTQLAKKLKPHQVKGVQYMWDACYESVERAKKTNGSGCILAHCMGLGKTLQVITLTHTLLTNEKLTGVHKVLVVCPLNTVLNWVSEYSKWLDDIDAPNIEVFELTSTKQNYERKYRVQEWTNDGGVLVIGYDMFRNLTNPTNKRLKKSEREIFHKGLVNPGPDLVVCDEGHLLKNEKTGLSIAMNRIHTVRRIVLTGTPMQNNMKEYYCMVQFVKPNLLGTYKEYLNRFVNPITNGQYTDSTQHDTNIMRKRSHVLHKMLDGVVQRKDYAVLTPYLPPKYEYVLFLTLSEVQINLYRHYLEERLTRPDDSSRRSTFLFIDFQEFQRICTHPRVLLIKSQENAKKAILEDDDSEGSLKDFLDDNESEEESSGSSNSGSESSASNQSIKSKESKKKGKSRGTQRLTRNSAATLGIDVEEITKEAEEQNEWWSQYCSGDELDNIKLGSKLHLLFEILQHCELIGDKLLVFSQSLYSLNIIEYFLAKIDEATQKGDSESVCGFSGSWALGLDYFRLDGSSSCDNRSAWCNNFNSPDNPRARLFLISTKAGGLGINLIGANRVIIFDVSWNPSHDIQSIYRVYRFGQSKPCYIYRFVTNGTMEMKIYERQVTKQATSKRVIDEQQIDRHYNQNDLVELYKFDPKPENQPTPLIPKDVLLAELLQKEKDRIFSYHEHQSLLENKEEEELDEAERKAAWEEFENEKTARIVANTTGGWIKNLPINSIVMALESIVQKDNPTWTREQIQSVVPLIVQQLREQVDKGEMLLFNRIVTELRLMQVTQQQRLQEYYMQQQIRMFQQRYTQQQQNAGPSTSLNFGNPFHKPNPPTISNEIVELND